jgi:hypothetical protein
MGLGPAGRRQLRDKVELDTMVHLERIRQIREKLDSEDAAERENAILELSWVGAEEIIPLLDAMMERIEKLEKGVHRARGNRVSRGR